MLRRLLKISKMARMVRAVNDRGVVFLATSLIKSRSVCHLVSIFLRSDNTS